MSPGLKRGAGTLVAILLALAVAACSGDGKVEDWKVYAIEYGSSRYPHRAMVHDAPEGERSPMSWQVWLIEGAGRTILVDTGFASAALAKRWKIEGFSPADEIIGEIGVSPGEVTDVILTHLHWDHAGNLSPWKNARFWIQASEVEWARAMVSEERPHRGGIRLRDLRALEAIGKRGRLVMLPGDREIAPGVTAHEGGKHTGGTQWIHVDRKRLPDVILASDNAYLRENVDRLVATGSCINPEENLAALEEMVSTVPDRRFILPGHDPVTMRLFGKVAKHSVEVR